MSASDNLSAPVCHTASAPVCSTASGSKTIFKTYHDYAASKLVRMHESGHLEVGIFFADGKASESVFQWARFLNGDEIETEFPILQVGPAVPEVRL